MEQINKDFLLFYDWHKILKRMSHKNAHILITAMVEYQANGVEPPEFPEKIRDVATLMFDQLRRRMENQANGRKGGEVRAKSLAKRDIGAQDSNLSASNPSDEGIEHASGDALGDASSAPDTPPNTQRQDQNKTKQDCFYWARTAAPNQARPAARAEKRGGQQLGSSFDTDDFFEAAVRRSLGEGV